MHKRSNRLQQLLNNDKSNNFRTLSILNKHQKPLQFHQTTILLNIKENIEGNHRSQTKCLSFLSAVNTSTLLARWQTQRSCCYASSHTSGSSGTWDPSVPTIQKPIISSITWLNRWIITTQKRKQVVPLWWRCGGACGASWCRSCAPCRTGCELCDSSTSPSLQPTNTHSQDTNSKSISKRGCFFFLHRERESDLETQRGCS